MANLGAAPTNQTTNRAGLLLRPPLPPPRPDYRPPGPNQIRHGLDHRPRRHIAAHALRVQCLARQLRPLLASLAEYDQQIAPLFAAHPDAAIFTSFPGAGACLAPRLVAAFGTNRARFPEAAAIERLSGVAPVTRASGQFHSVHRRYACAKFLLQTFHELANCSLKFCDWARRYYDAQRAKGKGHHAAVRALAFKWIRILWRCWHDRVPYNEATYTAALRRRGSPLANPLPTTASPASATV